MQLKAKATGTRAAVANNSESQLNSGRRLRMFCRFWAPACMVLALALATPATAKDESDQMMISGRGHGILFDGDARKRAGVPDGVAEAIWAMQGQLSKWRQDLHRIPELGHKETRTHDYLMTALTDMGYKPQPFGPDTGIIVDIPGKDQGLTIGVRADFDALPITEVDDGRDYRSTIEGQMHACGHDAHAAILLGVAKAFRDGLAKPPVNMRLIFQPAEEPGTGAKSMMDAGVLDGVDIIIGLHSDPTREWGRVGLIDGYFSAFGNGFVIEVTGRAAHAGMSPQLGRDAVLAGSYLVTQLQSIVSRNVAPPQSSVLSVSMFNAGQSFNQIADKAVLSGTLRAQDGELYETMMQRMRDVVDGTSKSFDMPIKLSIAVEAPGTKNNPAMFGVVKSTAEAVLGTENVDIYTEANMAGEDFAWYTTKIPGFYYWLGIADNEKGINHTLHTPEWDIDERALPVGVAMQIGNILSLAKYHANGGKFE